MSSYYSSLKEFKAQEAETIKQLEKTLGKSLLPQHKANPDQSLIVAGSIARSDSLPVDKTLNDLRHQYARFLFADAMTGFKPATGKSPKDQIDALYERTMSVSDLTENLYDRLNHNPNNFSYWFPALKAATDKQLFFKVPETKFWTLPIELSQFMRLEYSETNQKSRDIFNKILFDAFDLSLDKTYFVKTGLFSSKFEFQNAHVDDPAAIGEYFQVINNFAMQVGAGLTNDIVIREYIEDPDGRPTIYDGMPLRTEFRCFVDFDTDELIDIVPYWNPIVMKRVLAMQSQHSINIDVQHDYQTYLDTEDLLMQDYNDSLPTLRNAIKAMLPDIKLTGRWSLDIMKSGQDFYAIDMSLMANSALTDLIDKGALKNADHKWSKETYGNDIRHMYPSLKSKPNTSSLTLDSDWKYAPDKYPDDYQH